MAFFDRNEPDLGSGPAPPVLRHSFTTFRVRRAFRPGSLFVDVSCRGLAFREAGRDRQRAVAEDVAFDAEPGDVLGGAEFRGPRGGVGCQGPPQTHGPVFPRSRRARGHGSRVPPPPPPCSAYSAEGIFSSTVLSRSSWTTSAFRRHRKTPFTRTRSPLGSHRNANRTRVL
jgi:hypothetical protein